MSQESKTPEWQLDLTSRQFQKQFKKLDKPIRQQIAQALEAIRTSGDPRSVGKAMTENWSGYWRYRIGDYRVIVEFEDEVLIIVAIKVGHRRDVYKSR